MLNDAWTLYCHIAGWWCLIVFFSVVIEAIIKRKNREVKPTIPPEPKEEIKEQPKKVFKSTDEYLDEISLAFEPLEYCSKCKTEFTPAIKFTPCFVVIECVGCGNQSSAFLEDDILGAIKDWNNSNSK
jgi:hypothetical protein